MVWSEFWGLFTKYLQYTLLCCVATIHAVILLMVAVGSWLGLEYLFDKYAQSKKKNREKNEPFKISDQLEEE